MAGGMIAWCDIETTGVEPEVDPILEVAFVLTTDRQLTEMARRSWVIAPANLPATLERIQANEYVYEMHKANGLYDEIASGGGQPKAEVQAEIVAMLTQFGGQRGKIPLGGSGVERFESHFFRLQLPLVYERLFYWSHDIGNVRRVAKLRAIEAPATTRVADTGNHRAESDIDQHIAETKWFLRFFEAARAAGVVEQLAREDARASGLV